jgi:hypothetical protein
VRHAAWRLASSGLARHRRKCSGAMIVCARHSDAMGVLDGGPANDLTGRAASRVARCAGHALAPGGCPRHHGDEEVRQRPR